MKILIIVFFLGIVFSLGRALVALSRPEHERTDNAVSTALTIRVALSIVLVATLFISSYFQLL